MSTESRLNNTVTVSKFLNLVKEADERSSLKTVELIQLEKTILENFSKNSFLKKLVNEVVTNSSIFTADELQRYNDISNKNVEDENNEISLDILQKQHVFLKTQEQILENELLNSYKKEDENCVNTKKIIIDLEKFIEEFEPLLSKKENLEKTSNLDKLLLDKLKKLDNKKIEIDEIIQQVLMYVDLKIKKENLVKVVEKEYCVNLIKMKNVLENVKIEIENILKLYKNNKIKSSIWKKYLKDFEEEINNEENLITFFDKEKKETNVNNFNFDEFKEFLNLAKNNKIDELLIQTKTALSQKDL